jgi:hypothetical protein
MGKNLKRRSRHRSHSTMFERRRQRIYPFRLFLRYPARASQPAALKVISRIKHIQAFKFRGGNNLPQ